MTLHTVQSLTLPRAIVMITVVVSFWTLAGQRCEASCGDYLVHRDSSTSHTLADSVDRPDQSDVPANRSNPACPCQGPGCSSRSEVPAVPAPAPPEVPTEWACLVEQIRDRDAVSQGWSLESELLLVRHSSQRLDRPPRVRA